MSAPPGPRQSATRQTVAVLRDPIGYLQRLRDEFGPLASARFLGGESAVYVSDPELAREAFATDRGAGRAGVARARFLEPLVGSASLLTLDGEEWRRHRELLGPCFHGERIERFAEQIGAIAAAEVERWPAGELELRGPMTRITLEVILRAVFGIAEGDRLRRLRSLLPTLIESGSRYAWISPGLRARIESLAERGVPGRALPFGRFLRLRRQTDAVLRAEIAERRRAEDLDGRDDVLSMLLLARDEAGRGLDDGEVRDELMTLLTAGHETTATGLCWAFERLTRAPAAIERLRAELDREDGEEEYLDAVVRETLRVRPVVYDVARMLVEPLEIGGYVVPAGTYIAPGVAAIQTDPAIWRQPERFRPERFSDERPNMRAWLPFGGGRRFCIGSHLALLEMRSVIREVLTRVDLAAVDPADERTVVRHVTIQPKHGARVRVTPRRRVGGGGGESNRRPAARPLSSRP